MASIQIPNLTASSALTGSEQLEIVQAGVSVRTTTLAISQLSRSTPGGTPTQVQYNINGQLFGGIMGTSTDGSSLFFTSGSAQITGSSTGRTSLTSLNASATNYAIAFPAASGTVALVSGANVASVSNSDGTLTISPTTGAVVASLALGHANTWSGQQTFVAPVLGTPASGVATNLTGLPLTTGVTGILPISNGGTNGTASPTAGAIAFGTGTALGWTAAGSSGQVLTSQGTGTPIWTSVSADAVVSLSFGTTGLTPATATQGIITVAGTLNIANGGTGITSFGTGVATALGQNVTGSGGIVLATSPTLVTPALGTPSSVTLTNATGLPLTTGVTGVLPIANGGTNSAATPTAGGIGYGTGTAHAYTAVGTSGQVLTSAAAGAPTWQTPTTGTVTSVAQSFTGGLISVSGSPITSAGTLALTVAGTSGGVPYFSSTSAWASSALLAASALMIGGGAGAAPATTTTGTGVLTALGINVGSAGAFVTFNGALGTPSSGTLTHCTGLVPSTGLAATGTPSSSTYLAGDNTWKASVSGTVTSVAQTFTGGLISVAGSPITSSGTLALTVAGTSGGIPYFSGATTWATSAALAANAIVLGGGAGAAPATTTTGTGVVTALGVNTGSAGAFVVNGGALGTPSSGTLTNATGLVPSTGLAATGTPSSSTYLAGDNTWKAFVSGSVTSVAQTFTGGLISVAGSPITSSGTLALTVAGTSGGIPYFSGASTWASSGVLAANAIVLGGGAGIAPATTTTGTGVVTALGVNVGSAGAFVTFNGALGTPSSGTLTNATGLPLTTGVTGNLPVTNLNSGTSASSTTFWRGDGTWASLSTTLTANSTLTSGFANGSLPYSDGSKVQATAAGVASGYQFLQSAGAASPTWVQIPSFKDVAVAPSSPAPIEGDRFFDNTSGINYTYITDANGSQWVETTSTGAGSSVYTKTTFTATASQTTFTVAYSVGYVDVYLNGVKLTVTDYTATNGSSVVLGVAAALNDIVETIAWSAWSATNTAIGAGTGTSLALNGATLGSNALAVTGTAAISGAATASTFNSSTLAVPTRQVLTSGTTYTTPAGVRQIRVRMVGAGGGGSGGGGSAVAGSNGTATSFNSVTAAFGPGGVLPGNSPLVSGNGTGTPTGIYRCQGASGSPGGQSISGTDTASGGSGGSGAFGGGGAPSWTGNAPTATPNSGSGGGGGYAGVATAAGGVGGSAGEYVEFIINSPTSTYTYAVGGGGNGGTGGGGNGGKGADGVIIVDEFY